MNKESNMVRVKVTLNKEGDLFIITDFKKVKDGEKLNIHDNFINIISSNDSIINVSRVHNEDGKNIMTVSGASFDIVKGYADNLYLEMTNDEWGRFCFITKEKSYFIVKTDILFLNIEKIIKGTDYSALILDDSPLSNWKAVIDQVFTNNKITLTDVSDADKIEASSPVSVYNVLYKNKLSKVVFYTNKENTIIYGDSCVCSKIPMMTKDIFKKTDWSRLYEHEEEMIEYIPKCKGIIKETDKYISLLFYLKDPKISLEGYGSWELFKDYEFNKLNNWAQEAILRDAFAEMFGCQTIFGWDDINVIGFDEDSYVIKSVTRYSSFCESFDNNHLGINAFGMISFESGNKCNTDNLFVVTIAIVKDKINVYVN